MKMHDLLGIVVDKQGTATVSVQEIEERIGELSDTAAKAGGTHAVSTGLPTPGRVAPPQRGPAEIAAND